MLHYLKDTDSVADRKGPVMSSTETTTRRLLWAGVAAGPLFVVTAGLQAALRPGFDLRRHPISLLSLGDAGWIQIANFVVAGSLLIVYSVGLRRRLRPGPASRWAPLLFATCGAGMIAGGVFTADAGAGFPPGAPEGMPETMTLHGTVHAVSPPVAFLALVLGIAVSGRRLWRDNRRGAAVVAWVTAPVCLVLTLPIWPAFSITLFVAVALGLGWVSVQAAGLLRAPTPTAPGPGTAGTSPATPRSRRAPARQPLQR